MKYTESKQFQETAMKAFGNDIDGYLKHKDEINSKQEKIEGALKVLKEYCNSEVSSKVLAYALISEHRTNQQVIIKNLFSALKFYSEHAGSDDRNENAVEWAKSATEKETYFPYI